MYVAEMDLLLEIQNNPYQSVMNIYSISSKNDFLNLIDGAH